MKMKAVDRIRSAAPWLDIYNVYKGTDQYHGGPRRHGWWARAFSYAAKPRMLFLGRTVKEVLARCEPRTSDVDHHSG